MYFQASNEDLQFGRLHVMVN